MKLQFDAAPDELAVFLEEAEEQLQLLDQDILTLEKEGPNQDLLQEIFRAAHTLKGSSAAIAHDRMASLTHAMESLLDHLRRGELDTTTTLIDLLLQSLDALRVLKEEVITLEHSGLDPSHLVESLNRFLSESLIAGNDLKMLRDARQSDGAIKKKKPRKRDAKTPNPGDEREGHLYKISVHVDKDSAFPAARCLQVHLALTEIGTITESTPSRKEIEAEKASSELYVNCITTEDSHAIRDRIMSIPEIVGVRIENTDLEHDVIVEQDVFAFDVSTQRGEEGSVQLNSQSSGRTNGDVSVAPRAGGKNVTTSKTVRIDIERLDALMNLVGELVIDCTRLVQLSSRLQAKYEGDGIAQEVGETSLHIQRITDDLQDRVMKARMFPVSSVFNRFPRIVRDLAQRSAKKIEFVMEGEETELDRSVIEEIGDPLIHLLRNAVDHGIETPEERVANGKLDVGVIRLSACHRDSHIVLTVEDDGQGINPDRLRRAAVEKGLLSSEAAARMSDREALDIIFMAGFSTAAQVTDVSGRGVGMDIVRTNIHKLNGAVRVDSSIGNGTRFTLELPLTLAIMDALLVNLRNDIFAIPLASVTETLRVHNSEVKSVNKEKVIQLRGRVLPLLQLGSALGLNHHVDDLGRSYVVVVGAENGQVGIVVDSLVGEQQVVIKSLGGYIGDIKGVSGATILGDGRVALILDIAALVRKAVQHRAGELVYV